MTWLQWFKKLLTVWGTPSRFVFQYVADGKIRFADPLVAYRAFRSDAEFNIDTDPPLMEQGDGEAILKAIRATRRVFSLTELTASGAGVTDEECLQVLAEFFGFIDSQKKSTDPMLTSPSVTELPR